jgi:hypothetical protein
LAARSDAATDRVSLASAPAVASGLSMIVWVKIVVDRDDFSTICRFHQSSGGNTAITLGMKSNGTQPALFSPGNTGGVTGTDLVVGTWTCVGFAVNASGVGALYRGTTPGTLTKFTGTVPISQTPDGMTFFGRSPSDATEWLNGSLAYARAWAGQLSDAEMAAESASATAVKTSGLFDHWAYAAAALTGVNGHTLSAGTTALSADTDPVLGTDINGTGALTAPPAVASGTGTVVVSATGAATAPKATAAGTAGVVVFGSGAAVAPLAQAIGSASVVVTGSGALTAPPGAAAGAGTVAVGGPGALLAPAAAVSGTASVIVTATGDLVAPRGVVAGTGEPTPAIEGTGALVAPAPVVVGSGSVVVAGAGALTAPSPTVAGTATVVDVRHADGALVAPAAVLSGVGHVVVTGVGALVAPAAVVHGYDVAPQQRDITVHARLLPSRTTARPVPSRWLVKEVS